MKKRLIVILGVLCSLNCWSERKLTLADAIQMAQEQSLDAMLARLNFMSSYWSYRSYRAELLPSVNLSGNLLQYDHSTVETRNFEDGRISMVDNNSLTNKLTLSVDQNIAALGGKLSLQSYLYRLDQFNYDSKLYNSQPLRLNYTQPLRTFNELKWRKKTEPLKYERAKKVYLEAMETVTTRIVEMFFSVLSAQNYYEQSKANLKDRQYLFDISKQRFELGTVNKSELLQLELSLLNAKVDVRDKELNLMTNRSRLCTFLGLPIAEGVELLPPYYVPKIDLNTDMVLSRALENSTFLSGQRLDVLEAEKTLAKAKSNRGIQVQLNGELGFNRTANHFKDAFRDMENNQIVGLSVSLPIFDWGVSKGRVRMAEADLEAVKTMQEQEYEEYVQEIRTNVLRFNIQNDQCNNALRAQDIADERYEITKKRFETGAVTVTDLNTAWQEAESARSGYISQLRAFWISYYSLRKATLYDWIRNTDLFADYEKLITK